MYEFQRTIESLWSTVLGKLLCLFSAEHVDPRRADFITEHPQYVAPNNAMNFLSDNGGASYNLCHCTSQYFLYLTLNSKQINSVWSNFEIADMEFWRGEAYTAFFNYLDRHGGFYYEVPSFASQFESLRHLSNRSAGAMRLFIRLLQRSSRTRTRSSFSARSDMSIIRTHIVPQKRTYGRKLVVVATHHVALVNCNTPSPW
jgi:hypothetical protein